MPYSELGVEGRTIIQVVNSTVFLSVFLSSIPLPETSRNFLGHHKGGEMRRRPDITRFRPLLHALANAGCVSFAQRIAINITHIPRP